MAFWGPLSWTMIFGLIFGTILTLLFVPVMYLVMARLKAILRSWFFGRESQQSVEEGSVAVN